MSKDCSRSQVGTLFRARLDLNGTPGHYPAKGRRTETGYVMEDDPEILKMNVAHYREMLKRNLDNETRSTVQQLLAQALERLAMQTDAKK
jgi:hypothetical protein